VNLNIYDISGRTIKSIINNQLTPDSYKIMWDGRDNSGSFVSSGEYFLKLVTGDKVSVKSLTVVK
jgi:flagellar hook assembly protein FlgD